MPNQKPVITLLALKLAAKRFAKAESAFLNSELYGITDGKAVGTYLEHKFKKHLLAEYIVEAGNSANGLDLPVLGIDIKVTSIRQPQSSCPYRSARQKIFGLGYALLLFVYDKKDNARTKTSRLKILHVVYISKERTADYQLTRILREMLSREANEEDLIACLVDRHLPIEDIEAKRLAGELLGRRPEQGYLTISNALQWRLQYSRAVNLAGSVDGVVRIC